MSDIEIILERHIWHKWVSTYNLAFSRQEVIKRHMKLAVYPVELFAKMQAGLKLVGLHCWNDAGRAVYP